MKKPRILLIEDDRIFAETLVIMLSEKFDIDTFYRNGEEVLSYENLERFDIAIIDVFLEGQIDGINTINKIREQYDIPFIYITSFTDIDNHDILERMKASNPYGYYKKNEDLTVLPILIEFALYKHKTKKEKQEKDRIICKKEVLLNNIISCASYPIIIIDDKDEIIEWNKASETLFKYSKEEALGKQLGELISPKKFRNEFNRELKEFRSYGTGIFSNNIVEVDTIKKNGEHVPVELSVSRNFSDTSWFVSVFIKDISKQKETDEEIDRIIEDLQISRDMIEHNAAELVEKTNKLSESEEELKEINASKDKFFSILAHDLKGPFQALLGFSELLFRDIDNLGKKDVSDYARDMHNSALHLFKLLENLLQWSRLQRGIMEYNPIDFLLSDAAAMNIDIISLIANRKQISIENRVRVNLQVFADINMVNTALRNLLSNAVKFTPHGGKIILDAATIDNGFIKVSVTDNGVGIHEKDIEKLFRIDSNFSTNGTAQETGTGLGLILCKDLIQKNCGEIFVDTILGQGTTFSFTLKASS